MDTPAERYYALCLKAQKKHYLKIRQSRLDKYKIDHPNSKSRKTKLGAEVLASEEEVAEAGSSNLV